MADLRSRFGARLRHLRRQADLTQEELAAATEISVDFLSLVERGVNAPSFENLERLSKALGLPVGALFAFDGNDEASGSSGTKSDSQVMSKSKWAVVTVISTDRRHSAQVEIEGVTQKDYSEIVEALNMRMNRQSKFYEAIAESFLDALMKCPSANPSDLWRYLIYLPFREHRTDQSWKRASGQGLETAFCAYYNPHFAPHGIKLVLLSRSAAAFSEMGILNRVGQSKLDIAMLGDCGDGSWRLFGGVHVKASIAERISDDAPASIEIRRAGFFSPFVTLDMKAFPPPHGDEVNRGELQFPRAEGESDKRNYFERDGLFSACYSYNLRTPPTAQEAEVAARIEVLSFSHPKPDKFMSDVLAAWNERKEERCESHPPTVLLPKD